MQRGKKGVVGTFFWRNANLRVPTTAHFARRDRHQFNARPRCDRSCSCCSVGSCISPQLRDQSVLVQAGPFLPLPNDVRRNQTDIGSPCWRLSVHKVHDYIDLRVAEKHLVRKEFRTAWFRDPTVNSARNKKSKLKLTTAIALNMVQELRSVVWRTTSQVLL